MRLVSRITRTTSLGAAWSRSCSRKTNGKRRRLPVEMPSSVDLATSRSKGTLELKGMKNTDTTSVRRETGSMSVEVAIIGIEGVTHTVRAGGAEGSRRRTTRQKDGRIGTLKRKYASDKSRCLTKISSRSATRRWTSS